MIRDRGPSRLRRRHSGVQSLPEAVPPAAANYRSSPTSSANPNAGRDALLLRVGLTHRQRRGWSNEHRVSCVSLTVLKSASGHRTAAVACKVAIPAKLLLLKRSQWADKSAIQASALRKMRIKIYAHLRTFLSFTEPVSLRLRIPYFITAGRLLNMTQEDSWLFHRRDGDQCMFVRTCA